MLFTRWCIVLFPFYRRVCVWLFAHDSTTVPQLSTQVRCSSSLEGFDIQGKWVVVRLSHRFVDLLVVLVSVDGSLLLLLISLLLTLPLLFMTLFFHSLHSLVVKLICSLLITLISFISLIIHVILTSFTGSVIWTKNSKAEKCLAQERKFQRLVLLWFSHFFRVSRNTIKLFSVDPDGNTRKSMKLFTLVTCVTRRV